MTNYGITVQPYTLESFVSNLAIFIASLPQDFEPTKENITALPHPEVVKKQYRTWLAIVQPTCLRVVVRKKDGFLVLRNSSSLTNPFVTHITNDFVDFHSGKYFIDEIAGNEYLDKEKL